MMWIGAIFAIGLLIIVHEAGHYFVARWCKMRVSTFSIGFGPALLKWKRGDTQFQLAPIPFGGFVHIDGMLVADEGDENDPFSYNNRPAWQRFLTIFAGPGTNYLFAVVLALVLYNVAGVGTGTAWYQISSVVEGFDAAGKLEPGDRILEASWQRDYSLAPKTWEADDALDQHLAQVIADNKGAAFSLRYQLPASDDAPAASDVPGDNAPQGATIRELEITPPQPLTGAGFAKSLGLTLGKSPEGKVVLEAVTADSPLAAVPVGSLLLSVERRFSGPFYAAYNRRAVHNIAEVTNNAKGSIEFFVQRNGRREGPIVVTPRLDKDMKHTPKNPAGDDKAKEPAKPRRMLGIVTNYDEERVSAGFFGSIKHAFAYPFVQTKVLVSGLYQIATNKEVRKQARPIGPVGIAEEIKKSIEFGWTRVIELLMVLNVYLGLFNLFPLPALDGGRLVFLTYEMATRKRANQKLEATIHMVGIMILMVVLVLVTYKDCARVLQ